ncbi:ABC transporter permease [Candidatus Haliotispira prima]|uniref:Transport permease protein n=1 Tax=Candidatus Haliotispira prima TaxID=3034016 RepID=A0ABY8MJW0_9SPIO|nr:ABC transporter permease [Candidatus Haliotispira prima]
MSQITRSAEPHPAGETTQGQPTQMEPTTRTQDREFQPAEGGTAGLPVRSLSTIWRAAFIGILSKETRRILRIWVQTLLPSAVTTTLYFLIFGNLIGPRVGQIDGVPYMAFIVPGLIMMAVITNSYGNVSGSFFSSKFMHNIEVMLVAPVPNWVILAGYVGGGIMRGLLVGIIVAILSLFFVQMQPVNILIMLLVIVLTAIVFALAGFINAMMATKFDDISIVPTFVLTPLTYLGGVFYSINMLPPVFRAMSFANPVLYMINAFRYGVLGISDISIYWSLGLLLVFVFVFAGTALWLLQRSKSLRT